MQARYHDQARRRTDVRLPVSIREMKRGGSKAASERRGRRQHTSPILARLRHADRLSRASATLFRVGTNPGRRLGVLLSVSPVFEKVPARSPYSLCQTSSEALIYVKISSDQRRKFVGHWLTREPDNPVLREVGVIGRLREEQKHDQVDCYCWLRVIGCNIGASYDACADSSAGGYVHASRGRLRCWQDTS